MEDWIPNMSKTIICPIEHNYSNKLVFIHKVVLKKYSNII